MLILDDTLAYNMLIESLYNTCYTILYMEYKTYISNVNNCIQHSLITSLNLHYICNDILHFMSCL